MKEARAAKGAGEAGLQLHRLNNRPLAASSTTPFAGRWPAALVSEIAAAPSRRVAAELFALSQDAVDTLVDAERELLLATLQDTIAELPDGDVRRRGLPFGIAHGRVE